MLANNTIVQEPEAPTENNNDSEYFYEREAEYFGFTPFQLLDEIGEIVVSAAFKMFDGAIGEIGKTINFLDRGQLEAGMGQWAALVESRFGRNYELFETYVTKNVLLIPDNFVLPHHRDLPLPAIPSISQEDEESIDGEIVDLLQQLQVAKAEEAQLDSHERVLRQGEELLASIEEQLDFLKNKLSSHNLESVEHVMADFNVKLAELRQIVMDTIEQNKNLLFLNNGGDGGEMEERWEMDRRLQQIGDADGSQYVRELSHCQQIVTVQDLNGWRMFL